MESLYLENDKKPIIIGMQINNDNDSILNPSVNFFGRFLIRLYPSMLIP